jgi:leucyl aminopeptidase
MPFMKIKSHRSTRPNQHRILLLSNPSALRRCGLSKSQVAAAKQAAEREVEVFTLTGESRYEFVIQCGKDKNSDAALEKVRNLGADAAKLANHFKLGELVLEDYTGSEALSYAAAEGFALANYQFLKYRSNGDGRHTVKSLSILNGSLSAASLKDLQIAIEATYEARDLVNEPLSTLTATKMSSEIRRLGKAAGFKVQVFNKKKIQDLGMGGLLAVNLGSEDPPTFNIMEWKPPRSRNKKPVVLVGKGVVYDTGGLSLKPTKNSMDFMKCDMGGAAAVIGTMYALAKAKVPVHVIGLVPATDNRPGRNAYAPGDVINMYSGKTVEVLNTDAEGRMIMADALAWADQYKPELCIDLATLTGSAVAAIGKYGMVGMGTADRKSFQALQKSGQKMYERVVEFPFWEEYGDEIVSDIADIKNIGSSAGAITAGKFLEHFTSYPWIHLDIAGMAWMHAGWGYRVKMGTGVGVRLLFDFFKNYGK